MIIFELLLCFLSIIGIYAIFLRIAVWLMPHDNLSVAIRCDEEEIETVIAQAQRIGLYTEADASVARRPVALLEAENEEMEIALREEGIAIYIRK